MSYKSTEGHICPFLSSAPAEICLAEPIQNTRVSRVKNTMGHSRSFSKKQLFCIRLICFLLHWPYTCCFNPPF